MKAYCLGNPPHIPGIYSLVHKTTGHVYVGQTVDLCRRMAEWRAALSSGFGHTNHEMHAALKLFPDLDEWYFIVDKEMPGADKKTLMAAEEDEIERRMGIPSFKVLNIPKVSKLVVAAPSQDAVRLIAPDGTVVGQGTAAKMLDRHPDTIRDKVRWLRDQGVQQIEVTDLTMDRRHLLQKIRNEES